MQVPGFVNAIMWLLGTSWYGHPFMGSQVLEQVRKGIDLPLGGPCILPEFSTSTGERYLLSQMGCEA